MRGETKVSCAVQKDGGDDPDVTTGALIYAAVSFQDGINAEDQSEHVREKEPVITIDGGSGVGRVTRPGLDQPVGNAAINHVPREMIEKEVCEVCMALDFHGALAVEISVPGGGELAKSTFNPRLGIVGGISILGTSGIVEPMSAQALLDTIRVELRQHRALGEQLVAVSPGNYGLDFMKRTYDYDLDRSVKCSNFIGQTIDMAVEYGFTHMLMTGHIGKLIKVSGGINEYPFEGGGLPDGAARGCGAYGRCAGRSGKEDPGLCDDGGSTRFSERCGKTGSSHAPCHGKDLFLLK